MKKVFMFCVAVALLFSCSKNSGDNLGPVISMSSPANNQSYAAGQTVTISGVITDEDEIHEVHVEVVNKANNAEVLHLEQHPDAKSYTLSGSFKVQAGITYHIQVEADDHSGNKAKKEIEVWGN